MAHGKTLRDVIDLDPKAIPLPRDQKQCLRLIGVAV